MTNIYLVDSLQGLPWRRENAGRLINSTLSLQKKKCTTYRVNNLASYNLSAFGENILDKLFGTTAI